jgi:hypothetical protein
MPPGGPTNCSCADACEEFSEPASTPQGAGAPMDCSERRPLRCVQRVRIRRSLLLLSRTLEGSQVPELYLVVPCVRTCCVRVY